MVKIISNFLTVFFVCYTEVHCKNSLDPWVWPDTFVEDDKPFIEFTCGTHLKAHQWLSWREEGNDKQDLSLIHQPSDGYRTLKLLWPLASLENKTVYCRKENKERTLTILSKSIPITFKNNNYPNITGAGWGPWLMPAEFVDNRKRIEFTSYAYLDESGTLSCYQKKGERESKLGMIKQENEYSYVKITLKKTLEPSDNGSEIYCTRKEKDRRTSTSIPIPITFVKQIDALEPYLTVEPSTDVVFFDEGDDLEFVCSGSEPDDGRNLTWYLQTPVPPLYQFKPPYQYFYKYTNQNRLTLRFEVTNHEKLLYCTQELPKGTVKNGELLVRSRNITLLHRAQCNTRDQPRVIPATFVDEHKPYVQFTCYAFLKPGQLLSWYQSPGLNKSAGSLLRMIQLQDPKTKEGEWTVLTLNKTLEPADNGSEIYCAQQSVRPDGIFADEFIQTERISLTLQRDIPSLEHPFIRVEPNNANVSFHVNTTLRLTCGGTKPVDGRTYTWFKKESKSSLTVPKDQKYDASTNLNVLYLSPNESHHLNKLFCVQGFLLYIRDTEGSLHVKSYGELVISNITTLIEQKKDGSTHLLLSVATPLALLALLAAATACWALRRRRTACPAPPAPAPRPNIDDNYGDYANVSRIVTYTPLELSKSAVAARAPPAPDQALYAEIAREPPQATYATVDLPKAARAPPAPEPSLYAEIARGHKRKQ